MKLKSLFTWLLAGCTMAVSAQSIVSTTPTNKNVVLEELTGKTCQFCPDGHLRAQQLAANNPGRVVVMNIHTGGYASGTPNYRTAWGDYVGSLFTVTGYPTGSVNRRVMPNPTQADPNNTSVMTSRGYWASNSATIFAESSPVNVGGRDTIDLDTREVKLDVEAYYTAAGPGTSNKMHAIIMQNNIPGPQTGGSTYNPGAILPNGDYNHMHMVRHALTPNAGDNIATIAATTLYTNSYTYTMPTAINGIAVNMGDLEIAVYVSEGATTGPILTGTKAINNFKTSLPLGVSNQTATVDAELGAVCGTAADVMMQVTNMGNATLNTATFEYTINGGTPATYQHTFSSALQTGQYETVTIPVTGLSPNGATSTIDVSITQLNASANPGTNSSNGLTVMTAGAHSGSTTTVDFTITLDDYPSETEWELYNETTGSAVIAGGGYTNSTDANTTKTASGSLTDGHCYTFKITDSYGDGICCSWGNGSYDLTVNGSSIVSGGNFTDIDGRAFTFDYITGVSTINESVEDVTIMPNPVNSYMNVEFTMAEMTDANIRILNALGQQVQQVANGAFEGTNLIEVNTNNLVSGVYFLNITSKEGTTTKRFVVEK